MNIYLIILLCIFSTQMSLRLSAQDSKKYFNLVNNAELALTENNTEEALKLYESAFEINKQGLISDFYNAALAELNLNGFDSSKKYLNKLAMKGLELNWLESNSPFGKILENKFNAGYRKVYQSLYEFRERDSAFFDKILEFVNEIEEIKKLNGEWKRRVNARFDNKMVTIFEFDGKYYQIDTLQHISLTERLNARSEMYDSLYSLKVEKFKSTEKYARFRNLQKQLLEFLSSNTWPTVDVYDLKTGYFPKNAFYYLIQKVLIDNDPGQVFESKLNVLSGMWYNHANEPFSLFQGDSLILEQIFIKAIDIGAMSPEMVLLQKHKYVFDNMPEEELIQVNLEDVKGCEEMNYKFFRHFHSLNFKENEYDNFVKTYGIPSRADITRKFVYSQIKPDGYKFGFEPKHEILTLPSCYSLEQFMKSSVLVD